MNVDEATEMCQDPSKWGSIVSTSRGNRRNYMSVLKYYLYEHAHIQIPKRNYTI